jgi:hypothetical protein
VYAYIKPNFLFIYILLTTNCVADTLFHIFINVKYNCVMLHGQYIGIEANGFGKSCERAHVVNINIKFLRDS